MQGEIMDEVGLKRIGRRVKVMTIIATHIFFQVLKHNNRCWKPAESDKDRI